MEYRWVSHEQALKLVAPRVKLILDWAEALASGTRPVKAIAEQK